MGLFFYALFSLVNAILLNKLLLTTAKYALSTKHKHSYLANIINHKKLKMKKVLLTAVLAMGTLFVSAQDFLVTTTIEKDANDEYSTESFTNNLGFGYMVTDKFMGGITMADATSDAAADSAGVITESIASEMQLFVRYYHSENLFVSLTTPWGSDVEGVSSTDLAKLGVGYSINVWNDLNVEANYSMLLNADANDDRKGAFNFGLSYRF